MLKNFTRLFNRINPVERLRADMREEVDLIKSHLDVPNEVFESFQADRASQEYQSAFEISNPLVSVCVTTYNRGPLLAERSVKSILDQDYKNFELIVVGDCCSDDTEERMRKIDDPRLRFVNLPERGNYPDRSEWRWMVAGCAPFNHALTMAQGHFITHLDDDDEHKRDRLSKLVRAIQETRADILWHPFLYEIISGKWAINPAKKFRYTQVSTSSVFYHAWFKRLLGDPNVYRLGEPGDWSRFRKFRYLGANMLRYPEPLLIHYREKNQARK
jgi:glycosyltransferase involved in cell wall biosynthesis